MNYTANHNATRRRPLAAALVTVVLAFVLSACGAKLTAHLTLDDSWAGTRVITVTVPKKDVSEHLSGGIESADAAINKHLPKQLTYSGMSESGDNYTGTFTLEFSSKDDYEAKIKEVLAASGSSIEPRIIWERPDSELVSGVHLEENFGNDDLLDWATDALVVEGVAEEKNKNSILDSSQAPTATVSGSEYKSREYAPFLDIDTIKDNGVQTVAVAVSLLPDNYLSATVDLGFMSATAAPKLDLLDSYLQGHLPDGAKKADDVQIPESPVTAGRSVAFQADDFESLNKALAKSLPGSTFSMTDPEGFLSGDYTMSTAVALPSQILSFGEKTKATATFEVPVGQEVPVQPHGALGSFIDEYFGDNALKGKSARTVSIPLYPAVDGTTVNFAAQGEASGDPMGLDHRGLIVLIAGILIVLAVIFRKKLAVWLRASKEKSGEVAQQTRAQAEAINAQAQAQAEAQLAAGAQAAQSVATASAGSTQATVAGHEGASGVSGHSEIEANYL